MKKSLALLAITSSFALAQGPLMPANAPAPTMKTLAQIEARTPIPPSEVPAAGPFFTISQPGSYYLTGNITVTTGDAIVIQSNDVSLDLNGFTITSTLRGSANGRAIHIVNHERINIQNGNIVSNSTVSGPSFNLTAAGFQEGIGTDLFMGQAKISNLYVTGTSSYAIDIESDKGMITECSAYQCGNGFRGGTLRDCHVRLIRSVGISATTADNCSGGAIAAAGISADCATNCSGTSVSGTGILVSRALNCSGSSNSGIGLSASNATNCRGSSNTASGLEANIATNCSGVSNSGPQGLLCRGTASFCQGQRIGGVAIDAAIAIGCISSSGSISSPSKHLGTP